MIQSSDISVIVQGPIIRDSFYGDRRSATTDQVIKSIRQQLPEAEVILSTWIGQDVANLDCDQLVSSDDPGASGNRDHSTSANILRQIRSSQNGLAVSTRPFALKLRSDTRLSSCEFVNLWAEHEPKGMRPNIFAKKILVSAIFTPHPRQCPSPFWVSDFFAFGITEDVKNLWNVPFENIEQLFAGDCSRRKHPFYSKITHSPINAEQRLILSMAKNNGIKANVYSITTIDPMCLMRSERFIASHFLPVDPESAGFELAERFKGFTTHHTYRFDHEGTLFRSHDINQARAAWLIGFAGIAFACLKGFCGRIIRLSKKAGIQR